MQLFSESSWEIIWGRVPTIHPSWDVFPRRVEMVLPNFGHRCDATEEFDQDFKDRYRIEEQ